MTHLFAVMQAMTLFFLAPLFSGVTRVTRARMHNRRGPGMLQEYRDLIKLLGRQSVSPEASGWIFRTMPFVMVGVMLTIASVLPVVTLSSLLPLMGDLITLVYLFAIARFFFVVAGLDTGSPFTAIGASREALLAVLVEPIFLLSLWVVAQMADSTHISIITRTVFDWPTGQRLTLMLALTSCAFATFVEMGKLPFDVAEAEQELQEGPLTEYSGAGFAMLKWGVWLKQLIVLQIFLGVFLPWGQMVIFSWSGLAVAMGLAIVKLMIASLIITLIENSMARLRMLNVARITWAGFGFALLTFLSWLAA